MSLLFMLAMTALNIMGGISLLIEKSYPMAVMYFSYAVATAAMTWMTK